MYQSSDDRFEMRGFFLDMSKAFDRVWHEGLLVKLNQNRISGNLLKLYSDFLRCRKQEAALNGQRSLHFY